MTVMSASNNTDHDIGRLSEAVRLLQIAVEDLDKEVKIMSRTISEAQGGWRVLMLIGGSAAGLGAALGSWLHSLISLTDKVSK